MSAFKIVLLDLYRFCISHRFHYATLAANAMLVYEGMRHRLCTCLRFGQAIKIADLPPSDQQDRC